MKNEEWKILKYLIKTTTPEQKQLLEEEFPRVYEAIINPELERDSFLGYSFSRLIAIRLLMNAKEDRAIENILGFGRDLSLKELMVIARMLNLPVEEKSTKKMIKDSVLQAITKL